MKFVGIVRALIGTVLTGLILISALGVPVAQAASAQQIADHSTEEYTIAESASGGGGGEFCLECALCVGTAIGISIIASPAAILFYCGLYPSVCAGCVFVCFICLLGAE